MRVIYVNNATNFIPLGYDGESLAEVVRFDLWDLFKLKDPEGTFSLVYYRNGDTEPQTTYIENDDEFVTWTITDTNVAKVGNGKCQLVYTLEGGELPDTIAKSKIYRTEVYESLVGGE